MSGAGAHPVRVAAGILPAVKGGILPPGAVLEFSQRDSIRKATPAGQDARLYGRQDACRYDWLGLRRRDYEPSPRRQS
jgi:hypothetical protein